MCGICGAIGFENAPDLVQRMNQAMVHRGPDSEGHFAHGASALGMRRLKIIDLATGDQPVFNEDGNIALVFNGEIYNYLALYHKLEAAGHRFVTRSDTEVIVHAYEEWGLECLTRLRGMFTFALYDGRRQERTSVLVARDRMGIKPLYLWQANGRLLFASEVRALLASGQIPRRVSWAGVYSYLAMGSVQEPLSLVEDIFSLPPASWLKLEHDTRGWQASRGSYWQPPHASTDTALPEEVRDWLSDAVASHLMSEVPLGTFLSGGLDSGGILALGSHALDKPMNAFTLGFDNWPDDERGQATLTARRWNAHHQIRLISEQDILADLPNALADMDQPTTEGVNSWYVSREAKRAGLTVALSGVGGDELFAGYRSFTLAPRLRRLPANKRWLRHLPGWQQGWPILPGSSDMRRKTAAYLTGDVPLPHPYFAVRGLFTRGQIAHLLQPGEPSAQQALRAWQQSVAEQTALAARYDAIGEVSWLELRHYMLSMLLRDTDSMSMAHSLEVRVPFADHVLVEKVLALRGAQKTQGTPPKPLLKAALHGMLPDPLATSPKRTFTFPFALWLRGDLGQQIKQQIHSPDQTVIPVLNRQASMQVWQDFEQGQTNWARPWALYVLQTWLQRHLAV